MPIGCGNGNKVMRGRCVRADWALAAFNAAADEITNIEWPEHPSFRQPRQTHAIGKSGEILGAIRPDAVLEIGESQFGIERKHAS
jgi:hypothetical protein